MARPQPLTDAQLAEALDAFPDWQVEGGKLHRTFRFADFRAAFGFMTEIALFAERNDHHPQWWNAFHTVKVWLSTHDAGGITQLDLDLAAAMDERAHRHHA
jgi:4a-hydroxytetrahydrobiopterin dehydratase